MYHVSFFTEANLIEIGVYLMLFCDSLEWFDRGIIKSTSIVLKEKWNNQRPKDDFMHSTVLRSTNWAIEGDTFIARINKIANSSYQFNSLRFS